MTGLYEARGGTGPRSPGEHLTTGSDGGYVDVLARAAAAGVSRRQLVRLTCAAVAASAIPWWRWPSRAWAGVIGVLGNCPAAARKNCPQGSVTVNWTPACKMRVPNGSQSTYNGCGPAAGIDIGPLHGLEPPDQPLGLANFGPACDHHDCCYGRCGSDKGACDADFLDELLQACGHRSTSLLGNVAQSFCDAIAVVYYEAVAKGGADAYDVAQASACDCCKCPDGCAPCQRCNPSLGVDGVCEECDPASDEDCIPCATAGQVCCQGDCTDTQTDPSNCGACGHECASGEACVGGVCQAQGPPFYFQVTSEQYSTHGSDEAYDTGVCGSWGNDLTDASLPTAQTGTPTNVLDVSGGQWTGQIVATLSGKETLHVHADACQNNPPCDADLPPGTGPFSGLGIVAFSGDQNSDPVVQWPTPEYFLSSGQGPVCGVEESIASANYLNYQQTIPLSMFTGSQPVTLTFARKETLTATIGPAVLIDSVVSYSVTFQRVNADGSPYTG